jgi:hypothetical protein
MWLESLLVCFYPSSLAGCLVALTLDTGFRCLLWHRSFDGCNRSLALNDCPSKFASIMLTSTARISLLSFVACWVFGRFDAPCLVSILASTPLALMVLIACFDRLSFNARFDVAHFYDSIAGLSASVLRCLLGAWSLLRSILGFDTWFRSLLRPRSL